MKKQRFHSGWTVEKGVKDPFAAMMDPIGAAQKVTIPHDAMIYEQRFAACESGTQTGFYPCRSYTYRKQFAAPAKWSSQQVLVEFEGVMQKAMVYVNGELAAVNRIGYDQFYVNIKPYLHMQQENEIKVIAINEDKSSRWYSGSGLYRDVNLYIGGWVSILPEGVRIATADLCRDYAVLCIDAALKSDLEERRETQLEVEILDPQGKPVWHGINTVTAAKEVQTSHMRLTVTDPMLWSPDHPDLYTCRMRVRTEDEILDEAEETFGIRVLSLDARQGLRINGERIKLRGACIHHDNGVIGACTLESAERYRCRKLKEAGFNSIRSAHNPMSKAMLAACDQLGMLVMDELTDMWDVPKNSHDASLDFGLCWKEEIRRMVSKDYNHPCVIFYSVGNEIPECGTSGGRIRNRELANQFRREDPSRFVTCGINGFLALMGLSGAEREKIAAPFMPEGEAAADTPKPQEHASSGESGSEKLNNVMGDIPLEVRDFLNTSPVMTKQLRELEDEMDVIGLNYMPARHVLEHERNQDHVIMGSESYPTEIPRLWSIVEENPFVIGDFTWTGLDYLGEAGIGSYHYDVMPEGQGCYPDRLAYCGDIDLSGYRRPNSYLREIVYGLRKQPYIAVERVNRYGYGCLRNHWKTGDDVASWTFPGYEHQPARVKVFSASDEVELILNGKSLGRKPAGKDHGFTAEFETVYEPGTLKAIGYSREKTTGSCSLVTAEKADHFSIHANADHLHADGRDALILEVGLVDPHGTSNMWEKKQITIAIDGPAYLAGFGSADPSGEGSYQSDTCWTYDGRVIAVVRTTEKAGSIRVRFEAEGMKSAVFQCCAE